MLRGRVLNIVVLDIEIKTVLMKVRRRHISVYSGAVRDERDDAVIGGDSELEGDLLFCCCLFALLSTLTVHLPSH